MLMIDPEQRITVEAALQHPWFKDRDTKSEKNYHESEISLLDLGLSSEISRVHSAISIKLNILDRRRSFATLSSKPLDRNSHKIKIRNVYFTYKLSQKQTLIK
jgi:serine/threonine protein kinase